MLSLLAIYNKLTVSWPGAQWDVIMLQVMWRRNGNTNSKGCHASNQMAIFRPCTLLYLTKHTSQLKVTLVNRVSMCHTETQSDNLMMQDFCWLPVRNRKNIFFSCSECIIWFLWYLSSYFFPLLQSTGYWPQVEMRACLGPSGNPTSTQKPLSYWLTCLAHALKVNLTTRFTIWKEFLPWIRLARTMEIFIFLCIMGFPF